MKTVSKSDLVKGGRMNRMKCPLGVRDRFRFKKLESLFQLLLVVALFLISQPSTAAPRDQIKYHGKTPWAPYEHATLQRADRSSIDIYLIRADAKDRPTLVVLQGSHCLPLFLMSDKRRVSPMMFQAELEDVSKRFNVVVIERRGLKSFGPPPASEEEAKRLAKCTERHGGVTKASRVDDVTAVVKALAKAPWSGPIHLVGHSEGADVATGVARALKGKGIETLGLMSGAGNTRFYEYLAMARAEAGAPGAAQVITEQIEITGANPPVEYRGAAAARDLTYAIESSPLDDVKGLRVPIFVASGDRDKNSSIAGADVFVTELLRDKKQRLHYLMLPGLDHGYVTADGKDQSGAVLRAYLNWALGKTDARSVAVGLEKKDEK